MLPTLIVAEVSRMSASIDPASGWGSGEGAPGKIFDSVPLLATGRDLP